MISNQIIQEALVRLKRSGKRHIYLSELSRSHIKKINLEDKAVIEDESVSENKAVKSSEPIGQIDAIQLTKDTKSENIILLKEALSSFYPNDKLLFGTGSLNPKIVFLSEYPSAEEFQNNSIFAGKANELMEKILKAMGVNKEDVYFTSIIKSKSLSHALVQKGIKCSEANGNKLFIEYLKKELSLINPTIIISLGELAYTLLSDRSLGADEFNQTRGQLYEFSGYPVLSTFNPSYLLLKDSIETKRLFWEDLLVVMETLKIEISEKQKNYFKKQ